MAEKAIELEAERIILVDRWNRGFAKLNLFYVSSPALTCNPPSLLVSKTRLRREFKERVRHVHPSTITVDSKVFNKPLQLAEGWSQYFGLPVLSLKQASIKHRFSIHFSINSSQNLQITFMLLNRMLEIGPRLTISRDIWEIV